MFQAVEYVWGKGVRVASPQFLRQVSFGSSRERDEWVRNGSPFVNAPGYREPLQEVSRA
ncbi:MAG: hypothetical protein JNK68_04425 [Betaproteobacteria bacterium]|nr:hypothetical protein [Betaproteobacteria bacterium]